jgi:fumarylacetoacetate (FAA) hydrolase
MKLVSYKTEDREHLGYLHKGHIYNLNSCDKLIPDNMNEFLWGGDELMEHAKRVHEAIAQGKMEGQRRVVF